MKHSELRSIAHNIADSLASGMGFLVGYCHSDIFREVARCSEGHITIDFLTGHVDGCQPSQELGKAIALYKEALPDFFEKHGASISEIRELKIRYFIVLLDRRFLVTLADARGRQSSTEYGVWPGKRVKVLDWLGRVRPKIGA